MQLNLLSVKPFQETLNQDMCGPASLKMIFDYYGIEKSEKEIFLLCDKKEGLGVDDKGIKQVAESLGFNVEIRNHSTFEDIQNWLVQKVPVIVNWFTRGRKDCDDSQVADGHYSVAVALDKDFIYLQNPEIGKLRKLRRDDFMKVWFDFTGKYINQDGLVIRQTIAIYK